MLEIFEASKYTYGYRRIQEALELKEVILNHKTVKKTNEGA